MNFLYDLTATQPTPDSKFHGAGTYGEIVFFKLLENFNPEKVNFFAVWDSSRYINEVLVKKAEEKEVKLIDLRNNNLERIFSDYKIDRFYSALLDESINWPLDKCEVITTVHGLRSLEMPLDKICYKYEKKLKAKIKNFLKLTFFKEKYFEKVKKGYSRFFAGEMKIITVSNHSKASMISFFPEVNENEIKVFASPTFDQLENSNFSSGKNSEKLNKLLEENGIESKKYFILTSSARWIKNNLRAVYAFDEIFSKNKSLSENFKVVLTGVSDRSVFDSEIINKEKFVLLDYVERDELEFLEKNAYAFVYPSLNEGFGYPPVEAMKFGVPVCASGTSSIPEVCGDAAIYFDPYSISEIKNRIIQLFDKDVYNEFEKRAVRQYQIVSEKQNNDLNKMAEYLLDI